MKTRNSMQLKARINNKAKAAGVSPQLMLQNYMLERLIDRISRSPWRECVIVKGGMLIGSLIGVDRRIPGHSSIPGRQDNPRRHRLRVPVRVRRGVSKNHSLPSGNRFGRKTRNHLDRRIFGKALAATCEKRNSWKAVEHRKEAINAMRKDDGLERQWEAYVSKHSYAVGISFQETLNAVWNILESSPLQGD